MLQERALAGLGHRDFGRTQLGQRKPQEYEVERIGQEQGDAITFGDSRRTQSMGQAVDNPVDLVEVMVTTLVGPGEEWPLAANARLVLQHLWQGPAGLRKVGFEIGVDG